MVPAAVIQRGPEGPFAFVVKDDQTVEQRAVTVGQRVEDDTVVQKGLKPGETVVTEGQLRLEPGSRVTMVAGFQEPPGTRYWNDSTTLSLS